MPVNNSDLLTLAHDYAKKFVSYTAVSHEGFERTIEALEKDCVKYPLLANHLITSLAASRRLERIYNKQALAELILQHGKHGLYTFIGFALRSQLPSDTLFLYLTNPRDNVRRRSEFNFVLKSILDSSERDIYAVRDSGFGMHGTLESGYLFYFTENELEDVIAKLKSVDEKLKAHHKSMQKSSDTGNATVMSDAIFFSLLPPPPIVGCNADEEDSDEEDLDFKVVRARKP